MGMPGAIAKIPRGLGTKAKSWNEPIVGGISYLGGAFFIVGTKYLTASDGLKTARQRVVRLSFQRAEVVSKFGLGGSFRAWPAT
eukprot:3276278-Amphidinium_carterae.1